MTGTALQKASALALLVLLLLALPATAKLMIPRDFDDVTVVLAGGWEYPGLTVRWADDDSGLWVYRSDGARRHYRPEELAGLRDSHGRDITREVIPATAIGLMAVVPGGSAAPPQQAPAIPAPTEADEIGGVTKTAEPRQPAAPGDDWRFLLGIEGGWGKPHDTDFLDSTGGLGLGARVRLQLGGALYLAGGYDWQSLPVETHLVGAPAEEGEIQPHVVGDPDEGQLRGYWAGLALLSPADGPEAARFYLEGGVGRFEVEGMPIYSTEDAYLGYHAGLGFLIPLGTAAALDLGARGTHVVNLDLGGGDDSHTVIAFRAGLSILAR